MANVPEYKSHIPRAIHNTLVDELKLRTEGYSGITALPVEIPILKPENAYINDASGV